MAAPSKDPPEEESQKRKNDRVYSAPSRPPSTSKNGDEHESRDNEIATSRLEVCRYWLSGYCRNPSCSFAHPSAEHELHDNEIATSSRTICRYWLNGYCRNPSCPLPHPPLDELGEYISDPAQQAWSYDAGYAYKYNSPCYYYHNSHCKRGDNCLYLHDDILPPWYPTFDANSIHPVGNQVSIGSDRGPASDRVLTNLFEGHTGRIRNCSSEEVFHRGIQESGIEHHRSSVELHPSPERRSDQISDILSSPGEGSQFSPGCDALADGSSNPRANETRDKEGEREMLHNHSQYYDFSGRDDGYEAKGYAHGESDPEIARLYLPCDDPSVYEPDDFERSHGRNDKEKAIVSMFFPQEHEPSYEKRQRVSRDVAGWQRYPRHLGEDDGNLVHPNRWRQHYYHQAKYKNEEPFVLNPRGSVLMIISSPRGRGAKAKASCYDSQESDRLKGSPHSDRFGFFRQRRLGEPRSTRLLEDRRMRRHETSRSALPNRTSRILPVPKKLKPKLVSAVDFAGPKTLAEIKAQKCRADANGEASASSVAPDPKRYKDFEGPKPLRELLKKKQLMPVDLSSMATQQELLQPDGKRYIDRANEVMERLHVEGGDEQPHGGYATESMEEDDDDDGNDDYFQ